jgi:prevent-host-death family protein
MQVSVKELRVQPGRILAIVQNGGEVTVTMRGKPAAKIVPIRDDEAPKILPSAFGMWGERDDMEDVSAYVDGIRKGRRYDY